jgi:thiol-disulfide isomerase/thioredoxin
MIRYKIILLAGLLLAFLSFQAQTFITGIYRAWVVRQDSNTVVFNLEFVKEGNETVIYIINAEERIRISPVIFSGDSVFFSMPVFESSFRSKRNADGSLTGTWIKGTSGDFQHWPFHAYPNQPYRFQKNSGSAKNNMTGKWDMTFTRRNGTQRKAIAEFQQQGDKLTGSVLTPTGDARYLEGVVTGDSLKLSTFDGAHAYIYYARIDSDKKISGGVYYAGFNGAETWTAVKNDKIQPPAQLAPTQLKEGESKLNFTFHDLEGKPVSIKDDRFKNKVVIIQLMGSWCPNCMDETKFLSDYYNKNHDRGVEVIALAYEYSTDLERSKKSLSKFQRQFNVQYPMLITGVTSADEKKTEKTLPQLTPIVAFPTTLFLDKKGNVRKIHGVFYGPGTGEHFEEYKMEFFSIVEELLKES